MPDEEAVVTVDLVVPGMHCQSCVALIEETLGEQDGVRATADLDTHTVHVSYPPSPGGLGEIRSVLAELGYPAN